MKILIVADFSSIHIYNYIKNVISYIDCDCIGYHIVLDEINPIYTDYYCNHNIRIIQGVDPQIYKDFGAFEFTKRTLYKLKKLGHFDYLHLHAVRLFICPALFLIKNNYSRIILTYWGSDLYRSSKLQLIKTIPLLHSADIITMMTDDMREYFKKLPWYINRYNQKILVSDLGNMFYEKIQKYSELSSANREELGFESNKLICTIGYVGRPQMQQYKTIESILPLLQRNSKYIQLAIPAYGITESDFKSIDNLLKNSNISYRIFPHFMDIETVSKFRAISDLFIHAQTSDALSCAMLEHFYAGSIVVNGEWLKYSPLDNNDIYYITFKEFSELPGTIERILDNIESEKSKCLHNRIAVAKISSWEYLRRDWIKLYK